MSSFEPPRFVVRPHDPAAQRRRLLGLALAWAGSLLLAALVGFWLGDRGPLASPGHQRERQMLAENEQLKQQAALLTRSEQVARIAAQELKRTVAEREEEIAGLRADLAFYSRLTGGDAQREGLAIQDVRLARVNGSSAYNVTVTLTQNAKRGEESRGRLSLALEGVRGEHLVVLDWASLGGPAGKDGLPFAFKYFQQVSGTLIVPAGFVPNRLRVTAQPQGGDALVRNVAWNEALKGALE